VNYNK